jgi:hypothetical protein
MTPPYTLPRLAFFRQAQAITMPSNNMPFQCGVPLSNGSTIKEHLSARAIVGNTGNMIHRMAAIQTICCDRNNSSQVNLFKIIHRYGSVKKAAIILNKLFDGLVLTMSNILRKDASEPNMAELINELEIPVYCIGIGLQDNLIIGDISALKPDMIKFLKALDEKAKLFGVRGEQSLEWLKSIGIKNAQALGCPSMFAYPKNILSIETPKHTKNILSAGHISLTKNSSSRGHKLMRGFGSNKATYVFQGEIASFKNILDVYGIYDEATQTLDKHAISSYIYEKCGIKSPFNKYYSFGGATAWRQACSFYDVYIGDRIHGGVAAMQTGIPALILYDDLRVMELVSFHGIPSCSLDEFDKLGVKEVISKYLSSDAIESFKAHYAKVLTNFENSLQKSGLMLSNRA